MAGVFQVVSEAWMYESHHMECIVVVSVHVNIESLVLKLSAISPQMTWNAFTVYFHT